MTSDAAPRRRAHAFRAERQASFNKKVRKGYLDEGRRTKDAERARMEAYRRLCAREGVASTRLQEYDSARAAAAQQLAQQLELVDHDQSLTNNEKKKRKYNLKRKYAATTVTQLLQRQQQHTTPTAVTAAEAASRQRARERAAAAAAQQARAQARETHVQARRARNALYTKRTRKGQPVLASRVQSLLMKLQQDQPSQQQRQQQ